MKNKRLVIPDRDENYIQLIGKISEIMETK